jgi:ATP-dependent 26S proteasome regulatory subunit
MEVDEKPTESYNDIGGLDKQIEELVEAIVMPMQQAERFKTLGIKAPKGCLMYGPPGEPRIGIRLSSSVRAQWAD